MKSKVYLVSILTVFYFCICSSWVAWGALVMKKDGSTMNVSFDPQQTITVKTSSGELTVKLTDIIRMAGADIKRIRAISKSTPIVGEILAPKIKMKKGEEDILFLPTDIIFFDSDNIDLEKVGRIEIIEHEGISTAIQWAKAPESKGLTVSLLAENWDGNIKLSQPKYDKEITSRSNFGVSVDIEGYTLPSSVTDNPGDMAMTVYVKVMGSGPSTFASVPLSWPLVKAQKSTITLNYGHLFYKEASRYAKGWESYGKGHIYLYLRRNEEGKLSLGGGNLTVHRTVSNILALPINVIRSGDPICEPPLQCR
jgi:hypothetical protein